MDAIFNTVADARGPTSAGPSRSVMTSLGLVEGDILMYLEEHGATSVRHLVRVLEWPSMMVVMAVGALIRAGMVRGLQRELEVLIEPVLRSAVHEEAASPSAWR